MKRYQVILFFLFTIFNHIAYASEISLQDVINIAKANFEQIKDIEFVSKENRFLLKPEELSKEYIVQTIWNPEKKWEKQISKIMDPDSDKVYISSHGWDGEIFKSKTELVGENDFKSRKEGRISATRPTLREDIFSALGMKGNNYTYIDRLSNNASIENILMTDSRKIVVVCSDFSDKEEERGKLYRKYYIDIYRGGLPLKSELYVEGNLVKTVRNVEIAKIKDNLFLPIKADVYGKSKFNGKSKVIEYSVDVQSIKINQNLSQKYFSLEFEHNLPIWDDNIDIGYYHGVGVMPESEVDKEFFDQIIKDTKAKHIDTCFPEENKNDTQKNSVITRKNKPVNVTEKTNNLPQANQRNETRKWSKKPIWIVIVAVLLVVTYLLINRKKHKKGI